MNACHTPGMVLLETPEHSSGYYTELGAQQEIVPCSNSYNTRCYVPFWEMKQSAEEDKRESMSVNYHYFTKTRNFLNASLNREVHQLTNKSFQWKKVTKLITQISNGTHKWVGCKANEHTLHSNCKMLVVSMASHKQSKNLCCRDHLEKELSKVVKHGLSVEAPTSAY